MNSGEIHTTSACDIVGFGEGFRGGQERMVVAIYRTTCLDEGKTQDRVSKEIGRGAASGTCTRTFMILCVRKKKEEVGPFRQ